jgi:hypothetical protein
VVEAAAGVVVLVGLQGHYSLG